MSSAQPANPQLTCNLCGWTWTPIRNPNPARCPACNRDWRTLRLPRNAAKTSMSPHVAQWWPASLPWDDRAGALDNFRRLPSPQLIPAWYRQWFATMNAFSLPANWPDGTTKLGIPPLDANWIRCAACSQTYDSATGHNCGATVEIS